MKVDICLDRDREEDKTDERDEERTSPLSDGEVEGTAGVRGNAEVNGRVEAALVFIYRPDHLNHLKHILTKIMESYCSRCSFYNTNNNITLIH